MPAVPLRPCHGGARLKPGVSPTRTNRSYAQEASKETAGWRVTELGFELTFETGTYSSLCLPIRRTGYALVEAHQCV